MVEKGLLYRLNDLIPSNKDETRIVPMSRSSWWRGVSEGRFPQPIKLSTRITVWRGEDILNFLQQGHG